MGIIKKVQKGEYEIVDIFLEILLQQTQDAMVSIDGKLDIQLEDKKQCLDKIWVFGLVGFGKKRKGSM
jgi:hypothetical protein